jgi:hypothetical protein
MNRWTKIVRNASLAVLVAGVVSCGKTNEQPKQPAPPPPSEKVPGAPAPDNTVKSLPEGQKEGAR